MSEQPRQVTLDQLNALLDTLDALHSAAAEHEAEAATGLTRHELTSFLQDVLYMTQETLREVQSCSTPVSLRVLRRTELNQP